MYSFPESGISLIKQIGVDIHPRVSLLSSRMASQNISSCIEVVVDWMCWSYVLVKCKVHLPRPKKMPCCSCNPWPLIADCMGSLMILHWILLPYDWSSMPENVFTHTELQELRYESFGRWFLLAVAVNDMPCFHPVPQPWVGAGEPDDFWFPHGQYVHGFMLKWTIGGSQQFPPK